MTRGTPPYGDTWQVLLEMTKRYPSDATWLTSLLFDDLLKWNDWIAEARTLGPLGLVSLGSDTISGFHEYTHAWDPHPSPDGTPTPHPMGPHH